MSLGGGGKRMGWRSWLGVAQETTFGTQVTATSYMEFYSEGLIQNRDVLKLESVNTTRDYIRYRQGNETVEGNIEADLNPAVDGHIWILKQALGGTVSSASITATDFRHTLNTGDMENNKATGSATDTVSLSFSVQRGDTTTGQWHYSGCRVNNLTIAGETAQPVKMTADIIGKTATNTSETHTVAFSAIKPLHFTGISITTGTTSTTLSSTCIIGFNFGLNNNLISDANARCLGDRTVKILPPSTREVSLSLMMRFDTTTAYNNFINSTPISVQILLDSEQSLTAAGGSTYSMLITLPKCYPANNPQPVIGEKGIITQEIQLAAMLDNTTTGYSVQMQVNNATASY